MGMLHLRAIVLALACAGAALAFAPAPRHARVATTSRPAPAAARRASVTMMANFFENIQKGASDAATKALTGVDAEEAKLMEKKMTDGTLDFDDFLRQSKMMERAGSVASVAGKFGASLPGDMDVQKIEEAQEKMRRYSIYVNAMTEEERKTPALFIAGDAKPETIEAIDARVERVATEADGGKGVPVEDVRKFINEFCLMKSAAKKFATGMDGDQIKREMAAEQQGMGAPMSRVARRQLERQAADPAKKRKKGKAAMKTPGAGGFGK